VRFPWPECCNATDEATQKKENPMETTGQEVGRIEKRLRQLGTRLDRLAAKVDETGAEAKIEYRKQIDHIKEKHAVVQSKLNAFRAANGQKWDHFKGGVETAWRDFEDAFKSLKQ
jgi:phage host-nuclease inhibitor protein Gam